MKYIVKLLDKLFQIQNKLTYNEKSGYITDFFHLKNYIAKITIYIIIINYILFYTLPLYIWGIPFIIIFLLMTHYVNTKINDIDNYITKYNKHIRDDEWKEFESKIRDVFNLNESLMSYKNYVKMKLKKDEKL